VGIQLDMEPVQLVFLIIAAVLFGLAAIPAVAVRVHLGWLGALAFTLSVLLPAITD
jgi:hypothetical protein